MILIPVIVLAFAFALAEERRLAMKAFYDCVVVNKARSGQRSVRKEL